MIIAHLPAGYILSRPLLRFAEALGVSAKAFMLAGVAGALAPDSDMLYFYAIDHGQHHHHSYVSHYPVLWFALLLCSLLWFGLAKMKEKAALAVIFSLNGFVHILLDSMAGDVWWLAPWVDRPFALISIPALYTPWWLNFILHWSFALELIIVAVALLLWRRLDPHFPRSPVQAMFRVVLKKDERPG